MSRDIFFQRSGTSESSTYPTLRGKAPHWWAQVCRELFHVFPLPQPGGMSEQRRGLGSLARCTLRSWDPPRQEDMELCGQLSCFQKHLFLVPAFLKKKKKKGWFSFSCQWQTFLGVCMWGAEGVLACASLPLPACPGCGSLLQLPAAREIGRLLSTGGRAGTGGNCVQLGFITRNNPEHQYRLRVTC